MLRSNDATCAAMCQKKFMDAGGCPAFSHYSDEGNVGCTFGTVDDCLLLVTDAETDNTMETMVNEDLYSVTTGKQ